MTDLRYLHTQHIEAGHRDIDGQPLGSAFRVPTAFSIFFPGWIDADAYPFAQRLSKEPCADTACPCQRGPLKLKSYEVSEVDS